MKHLMCALGAGLVFGITVSAQIAPDTDWAQFGRYAAANSEVTVRPTAVLMGDSITDGWDNADPSFFTSNNFLCRGISGQTTSQMLVRFRQDVTDLKPEYVLILAGTNDIARNTGYISHKNIMDNIISMCILAKDAGVEPVLCSVPPAAAFGWSPEIKDAAKSIVELNSMIRKYAEDNGITYIDYHSAIRDDAGGLPEKYSGDGVHPNKECYKIMEDIVLRTLKKLNK